MKKITIVYHSTIYCSGESYYLKKHWGSYIENLSKNFYVKLICFTSEHKDFFHDYLINENENLKIFVTRDKNLISKFISRFIVFLKTFYKSDIIFLLMPSLTSIFASIIAIFHFQHY